jgi:hypothetical protein
MTEDETILWRSARFKVIAYPNAIDIDGFSPLIVKGTLSLK